MSISMNERMIKRMPGHMRARAQYKGGKKVRNSIRKIRLYAMRERPLAMEHTTYIVSLLAIIANFFPSSPTYILETNVCILQVRAYEIRRQTRSLEWSVGEI